MVGKKESIYSTPFSLPFNTLMHNCIYRYPVIPTTNNKIFDIIMIKYHILTLGLTNIMKAIEEFFFRLEGKII